MALYSIECQSKLSSIEATQIKLAYNIISININTSQGENDLTSCKVKANVVKILCTNMTKFITKFNTLVVSPDSAPEAVAKHLSEKKFGMHVVLVQLDTREQVQSVASQIETANPAKLPICVKSDFLSLDHRGEVVTYLVQGENGVSGNAVDAVFTAIEKGNNVIYVFTGSAENLINYSSPPLGASPQLFTTNTTDKIKEPGNVPKIIDDDEERILAQARAELPKM